MKFAWLIAAFGLGFVGLSDAQAQERSAAGAVETQMTWSALSSQVASVKAYAEGVNAKVDQSIVCGKKGMVYAPGASGVDAQGCKAASAAPVGVAFGGIYSLASSRSCANANNMTGACSCPAGFSATQFAYGISGVEQFMYYCTKAY